MQKRLSARLILRADPDLRSAIIAEARRLGDTPSAVIRRELTAAFRISPAQGVAGCGR